MTRKARQPTTEEIKISCSNCSLAELCLPHGLTETELELLEKIVKRKPPLQPGQHLYRAGDASFSLYAVRSGTLKSYYTTDDGDEQVLGFTLPGEMVGFDASWLVGFTKRGDRNMCLIHTDYQNTLYGDIY